MVILVGFNKDIFEDINFRVNILSNIVSLLYILGISSKVHIIVGHSNYYSETILVGLKDHKVQGLHYKLEKQSNKNKEIATSHGECMFIIFIKRSLGFLVLDVVEGLTP